MIPLARPVQARLPGRNAARPAARRGLLPHVPARLALVAVLLGTAALGFVSGTLARPAFLLGCLGVGYLAWREGAARSVECAIYLFCFAPCLRRIADYTTSYEASGYMLLGPLLAICVPLLELRDLVLRRREGDADLAPVLLAAACIVYGWALSAFSGEIVVATIALVKALVPISFGVWVMRQAQRDSSIVDAAARAFMIATPIMGAYGFIQYVSPWPWDRYWMLASQMATIGVPEPYQIRVFGTMNAPASFATYSAVGLLLFGFCRTGWQSALLALPVSLGLLLSMYRTAWISLVVGVLYCAVFNRTRGRAGLIVVSIAVATVLAAGSTEFGEVIVDRLGTLGGSVSEDGSGKERLAQFMLFYRDLDGALLGKGFVMEEFNGTNPLDGEVMIDLVVNGLLVGTLMVAGLLWAGVQALGRINGAGSPTRIVAGAVILGLLAQMPLASVSSGEVAVLFWTFVAVATGHLAPPRASSPVAPPGAMSPDPLRIGIAPGRTGAAARGGAMARSRP